MPTLPKQRERGARRGEGGCEGGGEGEGGYIARGINREGTDTSDGIDQLEDDGIADAAVRLRSRAVSRMIGQDLAKPCSNGRRFGPFLGIIVGCHGDRVDTPLVPPASAKQKMNGCHSSESVSSFSERVLGYGQHTQVGPERT